MMNVKIKLSEKFYNFEILKETKNAFNEICECKIEKKDKYFEVSLKSKEQEDNLGFEFANYALALMK